METGVDQNGASDTNVVDLFGKSGKSPAMAKKSEERTPDASGHYEERFQVRIEQGVFDRLVKLADRIGVNKTYAVNTAVSAFVDSAKIVEVTSHAAQLVEALGALLAVVHGRKGLQDRKLAPAVARVEQHYADLLQALKRKAD